MNFNLKNQPLLWASSTINDGNMSFLKQPKAIVLANRQAFFSQLSLNPNKTICLSVEHSDKIVIVNQHNHGQGFYEQSQAVRADGLITQSKETILMLLTADCLPVVCFDTKKCILGLVHLGWKNLDIELVPKVINTFTCFFDSNIKNIYVGIGPGITKDSYIKQSPLQKDSQKWKKFIQITTSDMYTVDLYGYATKQFLQAGILKSNLEIFPLDTYSHPAFFSHTQAKETNTLDGRMITVVKMK